MILEGLDKVSRKELSKSLAGVSGVMLKTRSIKGYKEPKNVQIIYICITLEEKLLTVDVVKNAIALVRANSNARFLA